VETEKHRYLPGGGVWSDVAVAEVSSASETQKLRTEYEQERRRRQRFHY
jgi:TPP-dependent trihydroxycyclohexane-1,2-dione (THcHDO) dehydratase